MFIYLSKKIAIPNNSRINALAWNKEDGYIAVGGEEGLVKVLKLDSFNNGGASGKGLSASSNLSMNQTLEGHMDSVRVLVWNEKQKKLSTSDQNGVIIVWMLYKGVWYEEMINNRKKSTVVGMTWSADGLKICIIYEDGAIIVGTVDGNRIWGKELKNVQLSKVQWSPDGKLLVFAIKTGEIHLYDNQGNFTMGIEIQCNHDSSVVVGLDWYNGHNGYMHALCPNLAICYENGHCQLMRNESDTKPVLLYAKLIISHCSWNHNGSLLAISGRQYDKEMNLVHFYNPFGEHLRTLKVPGLSISSCVWEGGSLRVALAVDSFVYFANIRPDYKWCYFKRTIVFTSSRPQKADICVSFWDIGNNQCHTMYVPVLLALAAFGDHCILVTRSDEGGAHRYGLLLCNALGTPVDGKFIEMDTIIGVTMNATHVIAASKNNFLIWLYKTPKSLSLSVTAKGRSKFYHVDDNPTGAVHVIQDLENTENETIDTHCSLDPICCLTCSDRCLIVGRESGLLQAYALPHVVLTNRFKMQTRPHKISLNCNSSRVAVIDVAGVMTVIDISESRLNSEATKLERKDVWATCWATDNPQLLAIMEKTRMYIFKGIYPEEPVACSGYICSFNDLELKVVLLDGIMESKERPNNKEHLIQFEVKSLRDTRQLLEKVGIVEASHFIEENPHPRLWRLLAEAALKEMNLVIAESAFVRSHDYSDVLFVKKLKEISSEQIRKAKIATYFKNFDEAERIYLESDRSDLALNLRQTLGDWFRVIEILKNGSLAPDNTIQTAFNSAADYFAQFSNWQTAIEYYDLAGNKSKIIECLYNMEDYIKLASYIDILPEGDPLLERLGDIFAASAVYPEAVDAYTKFGNVRAAIDFCIKHNRWQTAINLAKQHNINKIEDLFRKYTSHLLEESSLLTAIEVNIQAEFYMQAAETAFKLADIERQKLDNSLLKMKKHYIYAARLLQLHKKKANTDQLMSDVVLYESHWAPAEAFHYFMLAQEQLYDGKFHDALCTAYKLQEYTNYIDPHKIYRLLALTSCLDRSFSICSKAFIKLKRLNLDEIIRSQYVKLSRDIFCKNEPKDLRENMVDCSNCKANINDWNTACPKCKMNFPTCVASGKPIIENQKSIWVCSTCHHSALENKMKFQKACLLCHTQK